MPPKTKITLNIELPDDLSPLGRVREVTKRLLAVPKEEIDRRERESEGSKAIAPHKENTHAL